MSPPAAREFEQLCRKAVKCRWCFSVLSLEAPTIDIAQPRWIGQTYWKARRRVLVLMLNPGSGESRKGPADKDARRLIRAFSKGKGTLRAVTGHMKKDAKRWGRGRFREFYCEDLGLSFADIAFANIAWCSTCGNRHPLRMLEQCFSRHTEELLRILAPQVVLLSGSDTHRFQTRIAKLLPQAKIIPMLHFRHREGKVAGEQESLRIRQEMSGPDKVGRTQKR